jgi:hypothetical protein
MMFSPAAFFGGKDLSWFDFAAQAIGEAGEGSALTLAAMYAGVGRDDGLLPAPQLVAHQDVKTRPIFDPKEGRVERIRRALEQPLKPGGTAFSDVEAYLKRNLIDRRIVAKTGTFYIVPPGPQPVSGNVGAAALAGCGVVTEAALISPEKISPLTPTGASLLGTELCEKRLMVTGVHRYPATVPIARPEAAPARPALPPSACRGSSNGTEKHTTFAAVLFPKDSAGDPIVIALIVDLDECRHQPWNSHNVIQPLLKDISDWMH